MGHLKEMCYPCPLVGIFSSILTLRHRLYVGEELVFEWMYVRLEELNFSILIRRYIMVLSINSVTKKYSISLLGNNSLKYILYF